MRAIGLVGLVLVVGVGCSDKAKPKYDECVDLEAKGEHQGAIEACQQAMSASPASSAGKAAGDFLSKLRAKATEAYGRCVALEAKGGVKLAAIACEAAIQADPTGTAGKDAAVKLKEMQPALEKLRAEEEAQRRAAAEAAARAEAAHIAELRRTISIASYGFERDGQCIDKGLPPYRKAYEGAPRPDIDRVAAADGCAHLLPGRDDFMLFKVFCCPR